MILLPYNLNNPIYRLIGRIQLYHGKYDSLLKTIIVVLYSTFKLFAFISTNSIINQAIDL